MFDTNLGKDINLIINLAHDDKKLIVKGSKYSGKFNDNDVKKITGRDLDVSSAISPTFEILWGSLEEIEWLSVNYEGLLLSLMRNGVIGDDVDYGLFLLAMHVEHFKVL
jgi:hypothetical protein